MIKLGDAVRLPAGSTIIYECSSREHRYVLQRQTKSIPSKIGGAIRTEFLNAFDSKLNVVYLLKLTVVKECPARRKRGRPLGSKNGVLKEP